MLSSEENQREKTHTSKSIEVDRNTCRINIDKINESKSSHKFISKSEKLDMIKKVFLTNSSFNKHTKEYFITRFQIILILKESRILNDHIISKTDADLLLTKFKPNHNKYSFIDFVNYLTEICKFIFKKNFDRNPKRYMNNFLEYILNNYYECFKQKLESNYVEKKIDNNCTMNSLKKIIESNIDKHALKLLLSLYYQLKKIYICYFTYENSKRVNHEKLLFNSMNNFITFGKDFEIMPYILNEKHYVTYYNLLIKHQKDCEDTINDIFQSVNLKDDKKFQDLGYCFKFSTFILFLYHFSLLLYYKKFKVQFSINKITKPEDIEIIIFFLQKLEHSDGVTKYILKRQRTNESKFTFIPSNKDIELALKELSEDKYGGKTLINNINEYLITSSFFNEDNKDSTIENNTYNNYILNTVNSFDNNLTITCGNRTHTNLENSKILFKGEEICKNSKNFNEFINKQLIKNLNNTPIIREKSKILYPRKKHNKSLNKTNIQTENQFQSMFIPILDLENFLNVNSEVVKVISEKLDSLAETFLKYSKISDKLEFNRMSFSAFLKFLKNSNILIGVPDNLKNNYRRMGERLAQKNINVSEIKTYNKEIKGSVNCKNVVLTDEEKEYKNKISQIVNANKKDFREKISIGEAAIIFHSLTNTKNFPCYTESIKLLFDKNSGFDLNVGDNLSKAMIIDKKLFLENQQNVPGKMDFLLFIKSFELIAAKLYQEETLNNAVLLLLNKKIFPILPKERIINYSEIKAAKKKLEDKDIQYFLEEFAPLLKILFLQYSDRNENMKFKNFLEFYTQFDLFPELISLSQMKKIFFALNELAYNNNNNMTINTELRNTQIQTGTINFKSFIEAFAITAMFFNYKNIVTDLDRLLYLCYTVYNSKPIQKFKLAGRTAAKVCKEISVFLQNFIKKFEQKKIDEKIKLEKEKEKLDKKNNDSKYQLDLQFNLNEHDKSKDEFYNSFL